MGLALCSDAGGAVRGGLLLCAENRRDRESAGAEGVCHCQRCDESVGAGVLQEYFHFFVDSAIGMAAKFRARLDEPTIHIILPVGVSFFTFQSLSYTIDVYRNEIPAVHSLPRDYMMFASFFPQLVAGPIVRPKYFVPQMASARTVTLADVKAMMYLFLLGFIKKSCIADNISPYVDRVFNHPQGYSALASISATWLYTIQIFCDFSGYSDMAIAVAGLLGYKLVLNFNAPYLSVSIQELLAALAYFAFDVDSGLYLHLAGRTEQIFAADVSQSDAYDAGWRAVARGRMDVCGLGRSAWRGSGGACGGEADISAKAGA